MYLSLPLPTPKKRDLRITLFREEGIPVIYQVKTQKIGTIADLKLNLAKKAKNFIRKNSIN